MHIKNTGIGATYIPLHFHVNIFKNTHPWLHLGLVDLLIGDLTSYWGLTSFLESAFVHEVSMWSQHVYMSIPKIITNYSH